MFKVVILVVMCSFGTNAVQCDGCGSQSIRIKRGKYSYPAYPGPPQRFYSRPPTSYPGKGYSYTPPPSYAMDDEPQYPSHRPTKGRRPEGLGDEDINNIVKYLSKQDLDKIIEFAGEKERTEKTRDTNYDGNSRPGDSSKIYKTEFNPDMRPYQEKPDAYTSDNYVDPVKTYSNSGNYSPYSNAPLDTEESMRQSQVSFFSPEVLGTNPISDSSNEEYLPRPMNLRDDYEVSYTNNVPSVVKADGSYKVESFGELPLMNYNSKLHTLSSYHVPHYTVTTEAKPQQSQPSPLLEPAPPVSAARQQSDAHLKATKIWSHKSKGTAYTLHSDGTLSLEKPSRSRRYYG